MADPQKTKKESPKGVKGNATAAQNIQDKGRNGKNSEAPKSKKVRAPPSPPRVELKRGAANASR